MAIKLKDDKTQDDKPAEVNTGLTVEQQQAIREIAGAFARDLPDQARKSGVADLSEDPRYAGAVDAPDGLYRVHGSDWLIRIVGGRFVEASRAMPPAFGGPDVVNVPND